MGREAKYEHDLTPKLAESYAMEGYSDEQIAQKLGINRTTLYKWRNQFPELRAALKRGKEPVNAEIKMAMIKSATGYFVDEEKTETYLDVRTRQPKSFKKITMKRFIPPSPTTQIFLAKNRMPELFRDVNRYEITGGNGAPVVVGDARDLLNLSEEELRELDRILERAESSDAAGSSAAAPQGTSRESAE